MPLQPIANRAFLLAMLAAAPCASLFAATQPAPYPNTNNFGGTPERGAAWFQQCLRVQHHQSPAGDILRPPSAAAGNHRNASKLYYDKLHQAATSQVEWDQVHHRAMALSDSTVLMMLYANGFGVARDVDLAIKYACMSGGAGAEMEARVMHLARLRASKPGERFDQCDDITSGVMGSVCADIREAYAGKVRSAFLARVRGALTAQQQAPFDALLKAAAAFAQARGNDETDMSGTAGVEMAIGAEGREQEWLREHIAAFEKGQFKLPAADEFDAADAELTSAYQQLMQLPATDADHPDRLEWSTVEKAGVRKTQRAWIAYRDAWVRFAAVRYPALAPASLKTAMTQWRLKQLKALVPA